MATEYAEFQVYVVEVCQSCAWNHLASSYVLGTGEQRTPAQPARPGWRLERAGQLASRPQFGGHAGGAGATRDSVPGGRPPPGTVSSRRGR